MKKRILLVGFSVLMSLAACENGPKSSQGFSLPDGNIDTGQQNFVKFSCNDCHSIVGKEELSMMAEGVDPIMNVVLGGKTRRITTYGELVTSIINPSHKVSKKYRFAPYYEEGQSQMRNYNSIMTVEELSDLVAFLQAQYELEDYTRTRYSVY